MAELFADSGVLSVETEGHEPRYLLGFGNPIHEVLRERD
jgi:hypothetical protein